MQATTPGTNRTGTNASPIGTQAMMQAAEELTPSMPIDTTSSRAQRARYIDESEPVGSIPIPATMKGMVKSGIAMLRGGHPSIFLDKIGERIAFERAGTRLYDALLTKCEAVSNMDGGVLPTAEEAIAAAGGNVASHLRGESAQDTMVRIRQEELQHFGLLCDAMTALGGDPTAQTPCADVTATASMGLIQVVSDPRTTLAQSLNVMLTAELTDNAGWELLIQLADEAGENSLAGQFLGALTQEQEHLLVVRSWLAMLVSKRVGTPAV